MAEGVVESVAALEHSARARLKIAYSPAELAAVALLGAVVALWAALAGGAFSFRVLLAGEAALFAFYLVGSLFAGWPALASGLLFDFPLRLLVGYGVVNTALLALAWFSPFGTITNFYIVFALVAVALVSRAQPERRPAENSTLWAAALCVAATSLWCQDSLRPLVAQGDSLVFKPWVDGFYHSVHIRIFADSHGAANIEDFRLAGLPARPYHYGCYLLPAFIKQASGIAAYAAFAGVQAPLGVLFTGLAVYAFFGSWWSPRCGLSACAALLLLPDGAQQGMQNPFMSYHWLTQISPSATYGLALLAVAWLFVTQGCTQGNRLQLLVGWGMATIVAAYKLHYAIASALLLLLVPALFFRGRLAWRGRALCAAAACAVYALGLHYAQKVPGVPLIRFDGSSNGEVLRLVQAFAKPGAMRELASQHMGPSFPWTANLLFGIPYVTLAALGVFSPLLVILALRLRRRMTALQLLFPALLLVNFLVMFFGLALDFSSSTPDELSQRPIMIVYCFVVSWLGGALGLLLAPRALHQRRARWGFVVGLLLLSVPAFFGRGVQRMWAMPALSPVRVPAALVSVAQYLREHSGPEEVFQDSQFDRGYAIAALSERRSFVSHTLTRMSFRADIVDARSRAIDHFMGIRYAKLVGATARALGFNWFLLAPGDRVDWPPEVVNRPAFRAGSFALYRF